MPSWILAIDFGTSYTVAAARVEGRAPEIIEIGGERRMPSVVMVDPSGDIFVGRTAEDLSVTQPGSTLRALKNRLGDQTPAILGGRPHQVVGLVAALLREVYDQVVVQIGEPPAIVHLTHPATWNQPRINRLIEAAAKAGFPQPLLVPEPVAAALSYAADVGLAPGQPIVVYDLGGGTFDSAVVTARSGGFTVIGRPGGDQHIGGELFDELLVNHIGETLEPDVWDAIQVGDNPLWRQIGAALRNEARKAKEALSSHPYANVLIPLPAGLHQVKLTREEFHAMVRPYIAETIETLKRCVAEAGVPPEALAGVALVGGSSRSPIVEEMVREAFPMVPISRRGDPKATVAAGATLAERPSSASPGLWRSPVTQEASPGTAQQRFRLAPPPLSDPPVGPASTPPPSVPPVSVPPVVPAGPRPTSAPIPQPAPPSRPTVAVPISVPIGGHLQPEPTAMRRRRLPIVIGLLLLIAAVVGVFLLTRSNDDYTSSGDTDSTQSVGPGGSTNSDPDSTSAQVGNPDATDPPSTDTEATDTASTDPDSTDPDNTDSDNTDPDSTDPDSTDPDVEVGIGALYGTFIGHKAVIYTAQFSPDNEYLVTASDDGLAIVWNLGGGSEEAVLSGHSGGVTSAEYSPDGSMIATSGFDGSVRLWDARSGELLHGFTGHTDLVYQVRFSPDGGSLLSASADHTARLWDISTGSEAAVFRGSDESIYFAEFSPDGEHIVAGGQDDLARVWSVFDSANPMVLAGHTADIQVGSFSPDGTLILTGSDDARIRVWDANAGTLVYDLGNIEGGVSSATFSHDGSRLMASGADRTAALWDIATGNLLGDLAGHADTVWTGTFSPDDTKVVTASADGTAKIWDVSPSAPIGVQIATLDVGSPSSGAVYSPDGFLIATVAVNGTISIWAGG